MASMASIDRRQSIARRRVPRASQNGGLDPMAISCEQAPDMGLPSSLPLYAPRCSKMSEAQLVSRPGAAGLGGLPVISGN